MKQITTTLLAWLARLFRPRQLVHAMAKAHGETTAISIGAVDFGSYTDNSTERRDKDLAEVTVYADSEKNHLAGLGDAQFTAAGPYDTAASTIMDGWFDGADYEVIWGPAGNTTGLPRHTANYKVSNMTIQSPNGGAVTWEANFQKNGAITIDTYP